MNKELVRCSKCQGTGGEYHVFDYGEGAWIDCQKCLGKGFSIVEDKDED